MAEESKIERRACDRALDELGVTNSKLVTPGRTGFPDRIFYIPGGKPLLIEFKRPGEEPKPMQLYIHQLLRQLKYNVKVCDNVEDAVRYVREALHAARLSDHSD